MTTIYDDGDMVCGLRSRQETCGHDEVFAPEGSDFFMCRRCGETFDPEEIAPTHVGETNEPW